MKAGNALLLFVRNPEWGKVKTRLAADLGKERALAIYVELLRHTRSEAARVEARRIVYYSHFIDPEDSWKAPGFEKRLQQQEPDLGRRMLSAFQEILPEAEKAVIIGSDCPLLRTAHLEEAFRALDESDFVLGPATDGGYYLIGMKQPLPLLFEDMPWSTDRVAPTTLDRIKEIGGTCTLLPTLPDVDYAEDWERYGWAF